MKILSEDGWAKPILIMFYQQIFKQMIFASNSLLLPLLLSSDSIQSPSFSQLCFFVNNLQSSSSNKSHIHLLVERIYSIKICFRKYDYPHKLFQFQQFQVYYAHINYLMQKQLKQIKLEPLAKRHFDRTQQFSTKGHKIDRLKKSNAAKHRHQTEPSSERSEGKMSHSLQKNNTNFSQQYMQLVHKLEVNLSTKHIQNKKQSLVLKERDYSTNNQNQQQLTHIIDKHTKNRNNTMQRATQSQQRRSQTVSQNIMDQKIRTNRQRQFSHCFEDNQYRTSYEFKKRQIFPALTANEKLKHSTNTLEAIEQKNQSGIYNKRQRINKSVKKLNISKRMSKRQITNANYNYNNNQTECIQIQKQPNEINTSYSKIQELCFHIEKLINIFQSLQDFSKQQDKNNKQCLTKHLKEYVLNNKKSSFSKLICDDISHIQQIYQEENNKRHLKNMVFSERILIVMLIDLLSNNQLPKYKLQINQILVSTIGIYLYFVYVFKNVKQPSTIWQQYTQLFQRKMHSHSLHLKRQIEPTSLFIHKKICTILRSNCILLEQVKVLINEFDDRGVTVNRSFYELLKLYAIYLNNHQNIIEKNFSLLRTFATSPSPYLTKPPNKDYTLVLELDQTLIYTIQNKQKIEILLRPFVMEFLQILSSNYEIVIFTSSTPQYSEGAISQLPFISHQLFRYHCTRLNKGNVKDLMRLGRPLQKTIIVDHQQQNFALQKVNGLKISKWRGDDPLDQQLNILGLFLNKLAENRPQDVRAQLLHYKQFRLSYN